MNPYQVLSLHREELRKLSPDDQKKAIKKAHRKLAALHHPDSGGGSGKLFREIQQAYEILSDPQRRLRYDTHGRTDKSKVTPERIQEYVRTTMRSVVEASRPDGSRDDPTRENIRDKIILGLLGARAEIKNRMYDAQRRLERVHRLIEGFSTEEKFDPIQVSLAEEKTRVQAELYTHEDALEMSIEAEKVLKSYNYKVGPGPEGQFSPGPTSTQKGGSRLMTYPSTHPFSA